MKSWPGVLHCVLWILLLSALMFTLSFGQTEQSLIHEIAVHADHFPLIGVECVILRNGKALDGEWADLKGSLTLRENNIPCQIDSVWRTNSPLPLAMDVFIDTKGLPPETFHRLEQALQSVMSSHDVKLTIRFFLKDSVGIRKVKTSDLALRIAAQRDEKLTVSDAIQFLAADTSAPSQSLRCIILCVATYDAHEIQELSALGDKLNSASRVRFGMIGVDTAFTTAPSFRSSLLLFREQITETGDGRELEITQLPRRLSRGQLSITFRPADFKSLNTKRKFALIVNSTNASQEFTVVVPESVLVSTATRAYTSDVEKIKSENWKAALDTITVALNALPKKAFKDSADRYLDEFGSWIVQTKSFQQSDLLFAVAEKAWGLQPVRDRWYGRLKLRLLSAQLQSINTSVDTTGESIRLSMAMLEIAKDSLQLRSTLFRMKGDAASRKMRWWDAAKEYSASFKAVADNRVRLQIKDAVQNAIIQDFKGHEFTQLHSSAKEYAPYFADDFELRFKVAEACRYVGDHPAAIIHYEWLVTNWKKSQTLVTWNDLFRNLQGMYAKDLRFRDSFLLSQRAFRQRDEIPLLLEAVINLRATFLVPALKAAVLFWNRAQQSSSRSMFLDNLLSVKWPHFVHSVVSLDTAGEIRKQRQLSSPARKSLSIQLCRTSQDGCAYVKDSSSSWLVSRVRGGYLAIAFSNEGDDKAKAILTEARSNKMLDGPWKKLIENERTVGLRTTAEVLGVVLAAESVDKGKIALTPYWSVLSENGFCDYAFTRDSKRVLETCGDQNLKLKDTTVEGKRSAVVKAYTTVKLLLETVQYIEVAVPIYSTDRWCGELHFGVQLWEQ
jgi:hypothetical protein